MTSTPASVGVLAAKAASCLLVEALRALPANIRSFFIVLAFYVMFVWNLGLQHGGQELIDYWQLAQGKCTATLNSDRESQCHE